VEEARRKAQELLERTKSEAKIEENALIERARAKAEEEVEALRRANEEKIREINKLAEKNIDRAVALIVERITHGRL